MIEMGLNESQEVSMLRLSHCLRLSPKTHVVGLIVGDDKNVEWTERGFESDR